MQIQIAPHTLLRAKERGASESEIIETINSGKDIQAKAGRFGKEKIFVFKEERNGKFYREKKLEVYYTLEGEKIITITVYVFYGDFSTEINIDWEQTI